MERITNIYNQIINVVSLYWSNFLLAILIIIIFIILSPIFTYLVLKVLNFKKKKSEIKQISFYIPLKTFFQILGIYIAIIALKLPVDIMETITKIFKIIIILLICKGFANMANPNTRTFKMFQDKLDFLPNNKATGFICKVIKVLIYIIAGFLIITELGYNLNGLAAGLGIGSAVLALAVQDVAKNLLGGLTIITDQVFIVGDFIETEKYQGTVEDITFRSTRIRNLDGMQVTIPNGILANTYVVNYANMKKRRIQVNLTLDFSLPYSDLDKMKKRLEELLCEMPNIIEDSVKINYTEINEEGTKLFIYMYTDKVKYEEYLEVKGIVNEAILQIFEKENVTLELRDHIELEN